METNLTGNQKIIKNTKANLFIRIILILMLTVCVIFPILVAIVILSLGDGIHLGIIITFLLFWGCAIQLIRLLLWNTYGQEIIYFDKKSVSYEADYKYFRDGKKVLAIEGLCSEIIIDDEENISMGRIRLYNDKDIIETTIKSNVEVLEKIQEDLEHSFKIR